MADTAETTDSSSRITVRAAAPEEVQTADTQAAPSPPQAARSNDARARAVALAGGCAESVAVDPRVAEEEIRRFGSLDRVPYLAIPIDTLRGMSLDAKTGFLLSLVDGQTSFESLLDLCAMPPVHALRLFAALRFLGIIEFAQEERGSR